MTYKFKREPESGLILVNIEIGIFSDYNGLLGLDFLEGTKFCIDTKENTITLS